GARTDGRRLLYPSGSAQRVHRGFGDSGHADHPVPANDFPSGSLPCLTLPEGHRDGALLAERPELLRRRTARTRYNDADDPAGLCGHPWLRDRHVADGVYRRPERPEPGVLSGTRLLPDTGPAHRLRWVRSEKA